MKSFIDFIDQNEPDVLNESVLRTMSAIALTARIKQISTKIGLIKIQPNDTAIESSLKLCSKLDLIAQQNVTIGLLISQTAIMNK